VAQRAAEIQPFYEYARYLPVFGNNDPANCGLINPDEGRRDKLTIQKNQAGIYERL
jgi:hypothetical protein